jgi:hypothetical protein
MEVLHGWRLESVRFRLTQTDSRFLCLSSSFRENWIHFSVRHSTAPCAIYGAQRFAVALYMCCIIFSLNRFRFKELCNRADTESLRPNGEPCVSYGSPFTVLRYRPYLERKRKNFLSAFEVRIGLARHRMDLKKCLRSSIAFFEATFDWDLFHARCFPR